jgi:hypothetical protein
MTEEIAEVLGAMAAAFVGVIIVDMWLGGGMLGQFSPYGYSPVGSAPQNSSQSTGGPTPATIVSPVQIN